MSTRFRIAIAIVAAAWTTAAWAGDAYYSVRVTDLKFTEGRLPTSSSQHWSSALNQRLPAMQPYVVLDGAGEAYAHAQGELTPWLGRDGTADRFSIVISAPEGRDVAGRLFWPDEKWQGMVVLKFTLPASSASADARRLFLDGKLAHFRRLLNRNIPGGAWFRHQVRLTETALNAAAQTKPAEGGMERAPWTAGRTGELSQTYDLFTGGRAMSENLQLDRVLPRVAANEKPVPLDSLEGISIQEIDWKPLIKDLEPKLDPLAAKVPADQHCVFFPTFKAALAIADETKLHDTPVLRWAQPRSENADVVERYQRQLCLSMSNIARLLGPYMARSVALTGSDPFFPSGTDVAVLFETSQPAVLENALLGRISLDAVKNKEAKPVQGEVDGLKYRGVRSPDRSVSSYVARLEGAVVVTNSPHQLSRLASVKKGESKSIASLPEYVFFRSRYKLGDAEETALVFLSDPAIRRWCGPRWRIADSRRTRAAAVMAELQASQMDALVKNTAQSGPIYTDLPLLGAGQLTLTPRGVVSPAMGTLDFMTPIGEIPLTEVTQAEADAYRRWREGYQRNWNWAFDPVALRLSLGRQKAAADMTVMPLIAATQYRELVQLSQGATLDSQAGDRHAALVHFALALNRESSAFRQADSFLGTMTKGVSLGWIGQSVSVYADDDPFWDELAKVKEDDVPKFLEKEIGRAPVAVRVDVANGLKLAAFLTGFRAYVEQTSPRLTRWESLQYKDQSYVKITPGRSEVPGELRNLAIYYTTTGDALTVTLSEKVLQRTIDRDLAREKARADGKPIPQDGRPWLGTNVGLQVDRKVLEVANAFARQSYQAQMQLQAWNNLPILNEWKGRYPGRDPVAVHKEVWGIELVCPGGGKYVWNERWRTMESTEYGHPGQPKEGPPAPPVLSTFARAQFGLGFEHQGLRARAILERPPQSKTEKP